MINIKNNNNNNKREKEKELTNNSWPKELTKDDIN